VWSLYFVASKLGLAAWLAAVLALRGNAAVPSLEGWARRSPLLAIALVGAVIAGLGLPGFDSFDARLGIIQSATDRLLRWVAYGGWALAYLPFLRILWIGVRSPGPQLPVAARFRIRVPQRQPEWRDPRAAVRYVVDAAILSRLTIATILAVTIGLGAAFLAVGHASLSEAAAILPEPMVPAATAGP
jgi:formate hydrogenlyase subunit 3/multisubunit Na+/H+ antiporter MnhD subunit